MKFFIAQQDYTIGNFEANTKKILQAIETAKKEAADMVVFPELCIGGYPPKDLLGYEYFIQQCYDSLESIRVATMDIAVIIGMPYKNNSGKGKPLFNAAVFLYQQKIQNVLYKSLLPNYGVFDEERYFEAGSQNQVVQFKNKRIALTICEDLWNVEAPALYTAIPMDKLIQEKPNLIINIAASPFDYLQMERRLAVLKMNAEKYHLPILYCNAVGAQTDLIFDGNSMGIDKDGAIIFQLSAFEEATMVIDEAILYPKSFQQTPKKTFSASKSIAFALPHTLNENKNTASIHQALIKGVQDYFEKMGFKKAILGSSGGIDSAVALAIACEALGSENVEAVLMPSSFSSQHAVEDAVQLSTHLNNPYKIIPITPLYEAMLTSLQPWFKDLPFSLAEENIQSRLRGNILMALSNKFGNILLNTSNKSELAVGYGTLYGDMAGGLSVLGDCYKLQVYALAHYINRDRAIIPLQIIEKEPSAELRPEQKDSDSLPPYTILDNILYQIIERKQSLAQIEKLGFEKQIVERIIKMVHRSEYKRFQFCPILRISPKSFGIDRRIPIVSELEF